MDEDSASIPARLRWRWWFYLASKSSSEHHSCDRTSVVGVQQTPITGEQFWSQKPIQTKCSKLIHRTVDAFIGGQAGGPSVCVGSLAILSGNRRKKTMRRQHYSDQRAIKTITKKHCSSSPPNIGENRGLYHFLTFLRNERRHMEL